MNQLYYGDCLTVMQKEMKLNSVDLIYLDPPFNSNRAYNAIYKDETGRPLPAQIEAFCDLWMLDEERRRAIKDLPNIMLKHGVDDSVVTFWKVWVNALRNTNPKMLAYLSYMVERLVQMKIILKPTGSIYFHCDAYASHYIKVVMDGIFGHKNFRNEIVWRKYGGHKNTAKTKFTTESDTIFFYTVGKTYTFNNVYRPLSESTIKSEYKHVDENGRHYAIPRGRKYREGVIKRVYLDTNPGVAIGNLWTEKELTMQGRDDERVGYPTQKPLALLERIITATSNEGDVVFDPFCGCGTTLEASQKLKRNWIGIDIAIHAIKRVSAVRLQEKCGLVENQDYQITGIPKTLEGAKDLWERDTYQFQKWAVEMVEGFVTARKTGDGGVDGRIYFSTGEDADLKAMKLEVKGGKKVKIESLRALAGIIDEEDFPMGGFITLKTLGRIQKQNFEDFCRTKRDVNIGGIPYPRLQILSVEEILNGGGFNTPLVRGKRTSDQLNLFSDEMHTGDKK